MLSFKNIFAGFSYKKMGSVFNKELRIVYDPNTFYTRIWGAYPILRRRLADGRLIEVVGERRSPIESENPSDYSHTL